MSNAPLREAVIDLAAFQANLRALAGVESASLLVDVSANAYGHGLVPMARAALAAGAAALEVSDATELRQLESAGISASIVTRRGEAGEYGSGERDLATGLIRSGAEAYGVTSAESLDAGSIRKSSLPAVMSLVSHVASVKRVVAGHGVSYGLTYRTARPSTLVIVPVGYADGVPRAAGGQASVLLGGKRYPIAGRIAMDQFVLDVGDDPVSLGDPVIVFGAGGHAEPTADDWGVWAGTAGDEIVAGIGPRVVRRYLAGSP